MASYGRRELRKYVPKYYSKLIGDTFSPDGSLATEWASLRISNVLNLLGKISYGTLILDLGCGIGTFTSLLSARATVVGVDFSKEAMKAAKSVVSEYGNKTSSGLVRCDVQFLPFKNEVFDVIISADLVEHLYETQYVKSTLECSRVLKRDGVLAIYTPNPITLLSPNFYFRTGWPFNDPTHVSLKSPFFLYRWLTNHGFKVTKFYCVETQHLSHRIPNVVKKIARILWAISYIFGGRTCIKAQRLDDPIVPARYA